MGTHSLHLQFKATLKDHRHHARLSHAVVPRKPCELFNIDYSLSLSCFISQFVSRLESYSRTQTFQLWNPFTSIWFGLNFCFKLTRDTTPDAKVAQMCRRQYLPTWLSQSTSEKMCWMTVARASTLLLPWMSILLSWVTACFFFSACSLLWLCFAVTVPSAAEAFDAFCVRGVVLRTERDPVLPSAALEMALLFLKSATGELPFTTPGV